jgi:hypothetical protein
MGRNAPRVALIWIVLLCVSSGLTVGVADAAEVTIGADVDQVTAESGTCGFEHAAERPCTIVTNFVPGGPTMTAPCAGTVTRFRLNGIPRPLDHYSLRVLRRNADGTYTGTATSAPVQITTEGVNEYATDLPIATGELIGIDFLESTEEHGLRWVGGTGVSAAVLFDFPPDGTAAAPNIPSTSFYYLFDADVACASSAPPVVTNPAPPVVTDPVPPPPGAAPVATPPSNAFHVVGLRKATLNVSLASPGVLAVTEAPAKGKKTGPRLLKPSSASGGPGIAPLRLALTGAAKAKLRETGKVRLRASIAFTPTGGSTAVQVRALTVKKKTKRSADAGARDRKMRGETAPKSRIGTRFAASGPLQW